MRQTVRTVAGDVRITRPARSGVRLCCAPLSAWQRLERRFARRILPIAGQAMQLLQPPRPEAIARGAIAPARWLQPIRHWHVVVSPRIELCIGAGRRSVVIVRRIEHRLTERTVIAAGKPSAALERIVQRSLHAAERLAAAARAGPSGSPHALAPPQASAPQAASPQDVPPPAAVARHELAFPAMVAYRPPLLGAVQRPSVEDPRRESPLPPAFAEARERIDAPMRPPPALDIGLITDRVVETLDRRLIAAHERIGRVGRR